MSSLGNAVAGYLAMMIVLAGGVALAVGIGIGMLIMWALE